MTRGGDQAAPGAATGGEDLATGGEDLATGGEDLATGGEDLAVRMMALLGLARRAGRLAVGATAVEKMVKSGSRPIVVMARDAGATQKSRCRRWQPLRGVVGDLLTRDDMARQFGRQDLVVVAVADRGFVQGLIRLGVVTEPEANAAGSR